ncbi:hypothetical protein LINPERHAP2_LOCUS3685 [Linum perenne]
MHQRLQSSRYQFRGPQIYMVPWNPSGTP